MSSTGDLWQFDIERGTVTRSDTVLTSPDGSQRILRVKGDYWLESLESPESPVLMEGVGDVYPSSWSHDGQWVAFSPKAVDLVVARFVGGSEPAQTILDSAYKEIWGVFSPDDRYLAYVSDESGRDEVYVVGFPDTSQKWAVTNEECNQPLWWGDEIFFRCADRAMSLEVATTLSFASSASPSSCSKVPTTTVKLDTATGTSLRTASVLPWSASTKPAVPDRSRSSSTGSPSSNGSFR
ncbi:MAG: hypothetical protein E2P02_13475 [Acidobacteria bacterium]|nr:MAG: hypothetical protein E2P02_13475 [Acidobacteriota bacterium]